MFGSACQVKALEAPGLPLTRSILKLNKVPDPLSGVKSSEKADTRSTLVGPVPGRILPETFQLLEVSPAGATNGEEKVRTVSSKEKSA